MDVQLVERARSGDHEAFSALVRSATPRLYAAARLILRDHELANDAVQEALVLAWRHIRALRELEAWDAWLYRLTVRACTHAARRDRRRQVVELSVAPDREPANLDLARDLADRDRLGRALERLPMDQRTVMVLHFYLDLPLTDVAQVLGVPTGTAKSRLNRGLAALRRNLGADEPAARDAQERLA